MRPNLIQDFSTARNRSQFERCLLEFTADAGFEIGTAMVVLEQPVGAPRVYNIGNTPEAWRQTSVDPQHYRRDPVLRMLQSQSTPVVYDQAVYVDAGAGDLWEKQAAYGFKTGIGMAMHLPGGKHFALGFDRREPLPSDAPALSKLLAEMYLMAAYAQAVAERCVVSDPSSVAEAIQVDNPPARDEAADLDPTDLEILSWAAGGKSSWAIGMLLNLSETAVHRRMRRVRDRLGVATRQQAVARAVALDLVKL